MTASAGAPAAAPTLAGCRVVVTRASEQASRLVDGLRARGAVVVELPTIEIAPLADTARLDAALAEIDRHDWVVFTSANGARHAWARLRALGGDPAAVRARIAAVGRATAEATAQHGRPADWGPERAGGEALGRTLPIEAGARVLLLRSDLADQALAAALVQRGAAVDDVAAYRTVPRSEPAPALREQIAAGQVDALLVASPSAARGLVAAVGPPPGPYRGVLVVSIGPSTSRALRALRLPPSAEAREQSAPGLIASLEELWRSR